MSCKACTFYIGVTQLHSVNYAIYLPIPDVPVQLPTLMRGRFQAKPTTVLILINFLFLFCGWSSSFSLSFLWLIRINFSFLFRGGEVWQDPLPEWLLSVDMYRFPLPAYFFLSYYTENLMRVWTSLADSNGCWKVLQWMLESAPMDVGKCSNGCWKVLQWMLESAPMDVGKCSMNVGKCSNGCWKVLQ